MADPTVRASLAQAGAALATVSDTPRLDAELLMAQALATTRETMLLQHLDTATPSGFGPLLVRRLAHEPIAYITGSRAFWTIELEVGPGVLVPRPDSETLIEAALAHFGQDGPRRILDLGTGPGTLLLAALSEWPQAQGIGIDKSDDALDYARRNAASLGLGDRAMFRQGDWAQGVAGTFDLVLVNPPYIGTGESLPIDVRDHEPDIALFAGDDGLDAYRVIIPELPRLIAARGLAILEIGTTQADAVGFMVRDVGLVGACRHDLGGRARAIIATRPV